MSRHVLYWESVYTCSMKHLVSRSAAAIVNSPFRDMLGHFESFLPFRKAWRRVARSFAIQFRQLLGVSLASLIIKVSSHWTLTGETCSSTFLRFNIPVWSSLYCSFWQFVPYIGVCTCVQEIIQFRSRTLQWGIPVCLWSYREWHFVGPESDLYSSREIMYDCSTGAWFCASSLPSVPPLVSPTREALQLSYLFEFIGTAHHYHYSFVFCQLSCS